MSEQEKLPETKAEETKPAKADKAGKAAKKKPGIFSRISRWFREMKSELKKYCPFCRKHTVHNETK